MSTSKVWESAAAAVADIPHGCRITVGGFGMCGIPETLIDAVVDRADEVGEFTTISNNAGVAATQGVNNGKPVGLANMLISGQIKHAYCSFPGENQSAIDAYLGGKLALELTPQGTLAERLRAGGSGIPAFFTPTAYGTSVAEGQFPIKYKDDGSGEVEIWSQEREVRDFDGRPHVMETALKGDFALVKAWKADTRGNLVFRGTARNFNPDCCRAGKIAIVEVEEIVEAGTIPPDQVHLSGVFVDRVVQSTAEKKIEFLTLSADDGDKKGDSVSKLDPVRAKIVKRAAQEFQDGMYANLGIGMPTMAGNFLEKGMHVELQSENGLMGMGPFPKKGQEDPDLINAGKQTVTYLDGAATFSSSDSFGMIRGGHVHLTMLGGLEVSQNGDLANWIIPGKMVKGMGGAMDLVASDSKVVVTMEHTSKHGASKVLKECSLPLTGRAVVNRLITEMAVFDFKPEGGLILKEVAEGLTVDDVRAKTEADFDVASPLGSF